MSDWSPKRSGMACVSERSSSFTCHTPAYTGGITSYIPAFTPSRRASSPFGWYSTFERNHFRNSISQCRTCSVLWKKISRHFARLSKLKFPAWKKPPYCKLLSLFWINKKHLKNVGPNCHCEPPHAHSPGVATGTVARRLRIDVHGNNDDNNNDNAWQRGPLWPHRMGLKIFTRPLHPA